MDNNISQNTDVNPSQDLSPSVPAKSNSGVKKTLIIAPLIIFFLLVSVGSYILGQNSVRPNIPIIPTITIAIEQGCTLEAKICSDGSSVGRTGPNCEFTPCPSMFPTTFLSPTIVQTFPSITSAWGLCGTPTSNGSCSPGCVNYGVPLGCITKEQSDYCKTHMCPICLASNTLISTPIGEVSVTNIRSGMTVWSINKNGQKIKVPVIRISSTFVPKSHKVVHLVLSDGRQAWISPNHPTTGVHTVGELKIGQSYDHTLIKDVQLVPYWDTKTYDLLPDSDTGYYWANGILVGSSLK